MITKRKLWESLVMLLLVSCTKGKPDGEIRVNFAEAGSEVSESMYGIFFEEINHSGDGGLYAELVQNRGFEDTSVPEGYKVKENKIYPPPLCNHLRFFFNLVEKNMFHYHLVFKKSYTRFTLH